MDDLKYRITLRHHPSFWNGNRHSWEVMAYDATEGRWRNVNYLVPDLDILDLCDFNGHGRTKDKAYARALKFVLHCKERERSHRNFEDSAVHTVI